MEYDKILMWGFSAVIFTLIVMFIGIVFISVNDAQCAFEVDGKAVTDLNAIETWMEYQYAEDVNLPVEYFEISKIRVEVPCVVLTQLQNTSEVLDKSKMEVLLNE